MRITYQRLVEIRTGLASLKEKRLPNLDAELLVAGLWFGLKSHFEAYDEMVKKFGKELEDAKDDADARKAVIDKMTTLHETGIDVPEPKRKLNKDHLPKAYKGENGEANTTANAGIIIALGPELFHIEEGAAE